MIFLLQYCMGVLKIYDIVIKNNYNNLEYISSEQIGIIGLQIICTVAEHPVSLGE